MKITQQELSEHLGISQKTVSLFLNKMNMDIRETTIDEIRITYLNHLRNAANNNKTKDGLSIVHERVLTERVNREAKEFELEQKKNQLINLAQLKPEMEAMVSEFRQVLKNYDAGLKADIDSTYNIDVDIAVINEYSENALNHLAKFDVMNGG